MWDPVTDDQHRVAVPAGFDKTVILFLGRFNSTVIQATVLRSAEDDVQHFRVVLAVADDKDRQHSRALTCLYSSKTGLWGNLVSTPIPSDTRLSNRPFILTPGRQARLVGNSLYWLLAGDFVGLLEFDLERQSLTVIPVPRDVYAMGHYSDFIVIRAEGGGLGLFSRSDFTAQLWKRTSNGDGVASWELGRTIELDKLLSLEKEEERGFLCILGYAEDNNVLFLRTFVGLFMIHLESLQFKKLSGHLFWYLCGSILCSA